MNQSGARARTRAPRAQARELGCAPPKETEGHRPAAAHPWTGTTGHRKPSAVAGQSAGQSSEEPLYFLLEQKTTHIGDEGALRKPLTQIMGTFLAVLFILISICSFVCF